MRNGGHDTFHVFLQVHETRFLLLRWSGGPEVRAVPRIGSNCQPLLFSQVRDAALGLMASLSAFKDDCLPGATESPNGCERFLRRNCIRAQPLGRSLAKALRHCGARR